MISIKKIKVVSCMLFSLMLLVSVSGFTEAAKTDWQKEIVTLTEKAPGHSSVYIEHLATGDKISFQANDRIPSASVIKLFILYHLYETDGGTGALLNKTIDFDASKAIPGGILQGMADGAKIRMVDLALFMLCVSDNTATNILIDELGMDEINKTIQKLGAQETVLGRKMLDSEARKAGRDNYTSAYDTALVLKEIQKSPEMLRMLSVQKDTSKLAAKLPFDDADDIEPIFAHKTGELGGIQHDAGIFFYATDPVIVVVLTSDLKKIEDGREFSADIGRILFDQFSSDQP